MSLGTRPRGGQTHTLATMKLSPEAYMEVRNKLVEAGYEHCFDGDLIDMTGIGIVSKDEDDEEQSNA